jgi:hypothetical protein
MQTANEYTLTPPNAFDTSGLSCISTTPVYRRLSDIEGDM